jgi:ABC-2 type transport system permease protein
MLLQLWTLWTREVVRFYRQPSRIVGALGSPLLFWLLIGSGLGRSFRTNEPLAGGYLEYFYPGTLALIVLFTAIFSTISVIEDRQEGFLQGVLVAPVPRTTIVLGKILGSTALALMQAVVFLFISPFTFGFLGIATLAALVGVLAMLAFGLSGLGFLLAWRLDSTQGFHAIMNLFLVPMWMLSGALFPASGATSWIRGLMWLNPLTYGVSALRQLIYGHRIPHEPGLAASLLVIGAFGAAALVAGAWVVQRDGQRGS